MRKLAIAAVLAVLMTATLAGSAWARGDGWEPVDNQPFSFDACGVTTNWTFPVDREYSRATVDEEGIVHIQLTGSLVATVENAETGQSVTVNASGPAQDAQIFPDGDFLFQGTGHEIVALTPDQSAETGLPTLFLHKGPLQILFGADGSATLVQIEGSITDLCPMIT